MVWTDGRPGKGMPTPDVPAKQGPRTFNLRVWSTLHGAATRGDNFPTSFSCSADKRVLTWKKRLLNLLQVKPTGRGSPHTTVRRVLSSKNAFF